MNRAITRVTIPTLVRIKPGALARSGIYLDRMGHRRVVVFQSEGLPNGIIDLLRCTLVDSNIEVVAWNEVKDNSFEQAITFFRELHDRPTAIVAVGGGKALDMAKYVAFLSKLPFFSIPTSLSNDGFCSPQVSLTIEGKRRSLAAAMPFGVIVDTRVCSQAPRSLSLSGVGDLAAKFTAIRDWKLSFHNTAEPVDDFAALLSDGSVHAFMASPQLDETGLRQLATSLMMNGIAMEVCGSSRPVSGSEHIISHALDRISERPRLHGLQVGVATYWMSLLQKESSADIAELFAATGFWDIVIEDPFLLPEWLKALDKAPSIKPGYFTVLTLPDSKQQAIDILHSDHLSRRCFKG
jgi:glycerol-1-phosphate dehydrogenase [NAD(P)+]